MAGSLNSNARNPESSSLDLVYWLLVVVMVAGGVYANVYFAAEWVLYRVIAGVILAVFIALVALQTSQGRALWDLARDARVEVRKVIWPTQQETTQTTMIVVVVVLFVALLLWLMDSVLSLITQSMIG